MGCILIKTILQKIQTVDSEKARQKEYFAEISGRKFCKSKQFYKHCRISRWDLLSS